MMRMNMFLKRIIGVFLAFAIMLGTIPAYAAEDTPAWNGQEQSTTDAVMQEELPADEEVQNSIPQQKEEETVEETTGDRVEEETPAPNPDTVETEPEIVPEEVPHIIYQAQIQTDGWQSEVQDGALSGSVSEFKRLEALKIRLSNQPYEGGIEYRSHIQNLGWESEWKQNGEMSGTVQKSLRMEAIQIRLTGEMADHYDVYYRGHAQMYGWLGWAKNGESAGTESFGYRLEGIQIVLVEKGGEAPESLTDAFWKKPTVYYQSHVQSFGWQTETKNAGTSGTVGKEKRLEALKIRLADQIYEGGIEYRSHIEDMGWESEWKTDGALSGTTGKALQLEAVQIRLTGELAERFDVYYRAHVEMYGWLGWTKNGESAGTTGLRYRIEALQVVLVKKGAGAPGSTATPFVQLPTVVYQTHVQTDGWKEEVKNGTTSGTVGEFKRMESIKIRLENQNLDGNIEYRSHIQNIGWESTWKQNGSMSGTSEQSLRLEALQIRLTGKLAQYFDIYYRVHAQMYGWLGWAKNGESAGTEGLGFRLEAVQIRIVKKGGAAPGSTAQAFVKGKNGWVYENGYKYYYKSGVRLTDVRGLIGKQSSYLIKINKQMSCVTVYAKDGNNGYIIPVVAFACSPGAGTPIGTFRTSDRYRWHALYGAQGQWCTRITGHILFHSLPYTSFNNRTMMPNQYNRLGTWASSGCIRLRAIDAKWIYDNCGYGTTVTIYNSSAAGPLGKPVYAKIPAYQNWDPTDPTI